MNEPGRLKLDRVAGRGYQYEWDRKGLGADDTISIRYLPPTPHPPHPPHPPSQPHFRSRDPPWPSSLRIMLCVKFLWKRESVLPKLYNSKRLNKGGLLINTRNWRNKWRFKVKGYDMFASTRPRMQNRSIIVWLGIIGIGWDRNDFTQVVLWHFMHARVRHAYNSKFIMN